MRLDLAWTQAPHIVSSSNVAPAIWRLTKTNDPLKSAPIVEKNIPSLQLDDLSRQESYSFVGEMMRLDLAWPPAPHLTC